MVLSMGFSVMAEPYDPGLPAEIWTGIVYVYQLITIVVVST